MARRIWGDMDAKVTCFDILDLRGVWYRRQQRGGLGLEGWYEQFHSRADVKLLLLLKPKYYMKAASEGEFLLGAGRFLFQQ